MKHSLFGYQISSLHSADPIAETIDNDQWVTVDVTKPADNLPIPWEDELSI